MNRKEKQKISYRLVKNNQGFTLIEIMVVVVILGLLAGLVIPNIINRTDDARKTTAATQIQSIEMALKLYKLDNGQYPTSEQGLQALVEPPSVGRLAKKWREEGYMEKGIPKDPWGNDYVYVSPGLHGKFDLMSYGGDGEPGGEGIDADINNWEIQ